MHYVLCATSAEPASVALVLLKTNTLEDESNTHLALGRGVRGEGACTRGHGRERVSIRGEWGVAGSAASRAERSVERAWVGVRSGFGCAERLRVLLDMMFLYI